MEDSEREGKRLSAKGHRKADESKPTRTTQATASSLRPKPVPASKPKVATGVPMAGRSYATKRAESAREASTPTTKSTSTRPQPKPAFAAPAVDDLDLEEDFDLDEELELEPTTSPASADTPSRIYSTRRALAEQVNQDVADHPQESDTKGLEALKDRREAWKKIVKEKEEVGQSPYIVRWAKVSFFPLLYLVMSMLLLRRVQYEYAEYYDYDPLYMLLGFGLGAIFLVFATTGTLLRAKRVRKPIRLRNKGVWVALVVFLVISFYVAFTEGLAYAWLFSIGFLGAGLLVALIGFALEKSGKGVYWVKDPTDASDKRWLEFVPAGQG